MSDSRSQADLSASKDINALSDLPRRPTGFRRFLIDHWSGDKSLVTAFWINLVLISLVLLAAIEIFSISRFIDDPVWSSRLRLVVIAFITFVVFPWQLWGVVRSSQYELSLFENARNAYSGVAGVVLMIGLALNYAWDNRDYLLNAAGYAQGKTLDDYSLTVNDRQLIIDGNLSLGVSKNFARLLRQHEQIEEVVLSSESGHYYEAQQVGKLIRENNLDTRVISRCHGACVRAFVDGERRLLENEAVLSFHPTEAYDDGINNDFRINRERELDRLYYVDRGVKTKFSWRMTYTRYENNGVWFPSHEALLDANFVTDIESSAG